MRGRHSPPHSNTRKQRPPTTAPGWSHDINLKRQHEARLRKWWLRRVPRCVDYSSYRRDAARALATHAVATTSGCPTQHEEPTRFPCEWGGRFWLAGRALCSCLLGRWAAKSTPALRHCGTARVPVGMHYPTHPSRQSQTSPRGSPGEHRGYLANIVRPPSNLTHTHPNAFVSIGPQTTGSASRPL